MTADAISNDYGDYYNDAYGELGAIARPVVDAAATCIVARELVEAIMFITSHVGPVTKHPTMTKEEKSYYLRRLLGAICLGFGMGLLLTLAVAIPLATQVDKIASARAGVEIGEGVSKTIAFFFVLDLTFRLPKWFGISRFHEEEEDEEQQRHHLAAVTVENKSEEGVGKDSSSPQSAPKLASAWALSLSLFWNTMREAAEGGILTAITIILTQSPPTEIAASVLTGVATAIVLGTVFYLGAKYISVMAFGIAAAILAQLLAMGLVTGAVREYEEAYAADHGGATSGTFYDIGGTTGYALTSLEFLGWSGSLTAITLATWIISLVLITMVQVWHNVLGRPIVPPQVTEAVKKCRKPKVEGDGSA